MSVVIVSAVHVDLYIVVSWAWSEGPETDVEKRKRERVWESGVKDEEGGFIINLWVFKLGPLYCWGPAGTPCSDYRCVCVCVCVCVVCVCVWCVCVCVCVSVTKERTGSNSTRLTSSRGPVYERWSALILLADGGKNRSILSLWRICDCIS